MEGFRVEYEGDKFTVWMELKDVKGVHFDPVDGLMFLPLEIFPHGTSPDSLSVDTDWATYFVCDFAPFTERQRYKLARSIMKDVIDAIFYAPKQ